MNQSMPHDTFNATSPVTISRSLTVTIVQIAVGVLIVILNVITGLGLVRCRGTNKLLMMLLAIQAFSDTLVGTIFIYFSIVVRTSWFNITECIIRYNLLSITSGVSLLTVTMISVERILAIRFPYKHQDVASSKLVMTLIGLYCWTGHTVFVFISFQFIDREIPDCNMLILVTTTYYALNGGLGLGYIVIVIICNIYLIKTAREHIRKIVPTFVGPSKFQQAIQLNLKATLTSISVVIPFLILNLPMYVMFVTMSLDPSLRTGVESRYVINIVYSLVVINSAVNPVMYTWRMKELREQLKLRFGFVTHRVRNT